MCISENCADIKWLLNHIKALTSVGKHKNILNVLAYNSLRKFQILLYSNHRLLM